MSGLGLEMRERDQSHITVHVPTYHTRSSPSSWIPSWIPSWPNRGGYAALPTTSGQSTPDIFSGRSRPLKRSLQVGVLITILALLGGGYHLYLRRTTAHPLAWDAEHWKEKWDTVLSGTHKPAMWGWNEEMGWKVDPHKNLADLGQIAEDRYHLGIEIGEQGMRNYFTQLHNFTSTLPSYISPPLLASVHSHLPPSDSNLLPIPSNYKLPFPPSMISYQTIHQTDKSVKTKSWETEEWVRMNEKDGWKLNFLDDDMALKWVKERFTGSDVLWAWEYMHRGVLRADFLRYLLPLLEGGVYSDVDTRPLRPIEQWGRLQVEYLDLSPTDGPDWRKSLSKSPAVVIGIDVDVHSHPSWANDWPRPLGICQWTLASAPHHPIFIDAARRVIENTRFVEQWENQRQEEMHKVQEEKLQGWEKKLTELRGKSKTNAMTVLEWTGPGMFTDAVMAFILARYRVTWWRLRGLDHPLRIGDVLILPITSFSPGGEPDFGAEAPDSPQADVLHGFRGSWKGEGWR